MSHEILLVEDSEADEKLTVLAFRRGGVANDLAIVRDGAEAIEYLFATGRYAGRDPKELPQLVLLDLKLPRVDGFDVLRRIREHPSTKLLPVVVLTSSVEEEDIVRSYALGANAYVRKPVEFSQLTEAAKALGLSWVLLNETAH